MSGRKFNPMHSVHVREPYNVKKYGYPDKPYRIEWSYPIMRYNRFIGEGRRRMLATPEAAFEFAVKHSIPPDRMPKLIRRRLCQLAHIAATVAS